jgi:hypothetical protein
MHRSDSENTPLRDREPRAAATSPGGVLAGRRWFLKLIIASLAVMTLLAAATPAVAGRPSR